MIQVYYRIGTNKNEGLSGVNIYFNLAKNTLTTYRSKQKFDLALCNSVWIHMVNNKKIKQ